MARRNQPYIPLYADDFQTDEKLIMCSAESTGVFIRIMCLMHKSDPYGKILLKQKFKQSFKPIENFASQLAIYFPYDRHLIERAILELVAEDVLQMEGDYLVQKRMVRDAEISELRGENGKKGGKKSAEKRGQISSPNANDFAQAKSQANSGNGIGIENGIGVEDDQEKGGVGERGLAVVKKETGLSHQSEYDRYIDLFNRARGSNFRGDKKSRQQFNARIKEGVKVEEMITALTNAMRNDHHRNNGYQYLTPEFFTRQDKIEMHLNATTPATDPNRKVFGTTTVSDVQQNAAKFAELINQKNT